MTGGWLAAAMRVEGQAVSPLLLVLLLLLLLLLKVWRPLGQAAHQHLCNGTTMTPHIDVNKHGRCAVHLTVFHRTSRRFPVCAGSAGCRYVLG
jgi:hypothetical protein